MTWYPNQPAIYDINKTYLDNADHGPFFVADIPPRKMPPKSRWIDFLGHHIATPIGIPAGPLLNARWIKLAAELGFDVLTYKTIRSHEYPSHPLPNMIYVDTKGMIPDNNPSITARRIHKPTPHIEDLAVTNSFGMPSRSPSYLFEDIERANTFLKEGQVMIVSIVGSIIPHVSFLQDFIYAARLAKEAGAKIIEANFSCPNVDKKEGILYMSPATVAEFGAALVKAIHPIPLIIKVGLFPSVDLMKEVMCAAAKAGVHALAGINTVSMQVQDEEGKPALGEKRLTSGICGGPIRQVALDFVQQAHQINRKQKLGLTLIGCGGITLPEHFDQFLDAGADVATSATGMMWDPYLAARYHQLHME